MAESGEAVPVLAAFAYLPEPLAAHHELVVDLVQETAEIAGARPRTVFSTTVGGRPSRMMRYAPERAIELMGPENAGSISVIELLRSPRRFGVDACLRFNPVLDPRNAAPPAITLTLEIEPRLALAGAARFLRFVARHREVLHGGACLVRDYWKAEMEVSMVLIDSEKQPPDLVARLRYDHRNGDELWVRIRRAYPVTMIGGDLLAAVGGVAALHDTGCEVEVVGEAALVTAVPELVGLDDPEFLRRARALRTLLWPHSIQYGPDESTTDSPENDA